MNDKTGCGSRLARLVRSRVFLVCTVLAVAVAYVLGGLAAALGIYYMNLGFFYDPVTCLAERAHLSLSCINLYGDSFTNEVEIPLSLVRELLPTSSSEIFIAGSRYLPTAEEMQRDPKVGWIGRCRLPDKETIYRKELQLLGEMDPVKGRRDSIFSAFWDSIYFPWCKDWARNPDLSLEQRRRSEYRRRKQLQNLTLAVAAMANDYQYVYSKGFEFERAARAAAKELEGKDKEQSEALIAQAAFLRLYQVSGLCELERYSEALQIIKGTYPLLKKGKETTGVGRTLAALEMSLCLKTGQPETAVKVCERFLRQASQSGATQGKQLGATYENSKDYVDKFLAPALAQALIWEELGHEAWAAGVYHRILDDSKKLGFAEDLAEERELVTALSIRLSREPGKPDSIEKVKWIEELAIQKLGGINSIWLGAAIYTCDKIIAKEKHSSGGRERLLEAYLHKGRLLGVIEHVAQLAGMSFTYEECRKICQQALAIVDKLPNESRAEVERQLFDLIRVFINDGCDPSNDLILIFNPVLSLLSGANLGHTAQALYLAPQVGWLICCSAQVLL